tara:strand:- start:44 stop:511 length:468 start_codon:yes stop_codon:yes gene_type:complete
MNKLLIILVALLWCNVGVADELFGIKLGDDIKNYSKDGIYIKPKKPNPDFENYSVDTNKRNKIYRIQALLKRKFDTKKSCGERLQYYTGVVHERLSKTKNPIFRTKEHMVYLDNYNKPKLSLWGLCSKDLDSDHFIAAIVLEDWFVKKDISKEGL